MNLCPTCKTSFSGGEQFCPRDGTPLRPSLPEDPLAGRVLSGRYRLVEVIGRGGMGAVYRAHHILMDKGVAVKVLRQELASDTEAVARFHREARSASRLDHENIIRVSDFGQTDDGLLFLVMELLDGENLAQALRRGALPWRRAATVARDVAVGLAHAHEQGVIHRDLKPENILLVRRGKSRPAGLQAVKVLDFGLAKLVHITKHSAEGDGSDGEADAEPDVAIQSLTRTGVVFGTPEYMSPEQAEGRSLDARTDLYALGVVLYQMVSGKLPFSAPTFLALIAKTVNEAPPPLREQDPTLSLPIEFESLILRCLAKSPDDRPQSAEELAEELAELISRFPEEPSRSGEVPLTGSPTPATGRAASPVPAGGVARTVQRHLPPGQSPRTAPKDAAAASSSPSSSPAITSGDAKSISHDAAPSSRPSSPRVPSGALASEAVRSAETRSSKAPETAHSSTGYEGQETGSRSKIERAPAPVSHQSAESADLGESAERRAELDDGQEGEGDADVALTVPRRPYWIAAIAVVALILGAGYLAKPSLFGRSATTGPPTSPEREPLRRARELLAGQPPAPALVEESLRILRDEREVRNSPEVHRLLSRAYEAQNNRLRALGHLYTAVRLSASAASSSPQVSAANGLETARSQLALSQLLSRLGHSHDACQTAMKLTAAGPADADLRRQAEALVATLRCRQRN